MSLNQSSIVSEAPKIAINSCKKKKKEKRSMKEDELLALQEAIEFASKLPSKRVRKITVDRDQAYVDACLTQQSKQHRCGGFVSGSGYHYDREY
jgi:hypothetical protein